ncbi:hypothetical protein Poli38472_002540 [Pythium oligandrum]|uniref:AP-1 complex subunit gamma n=1 Tax=Pythium oligandrum TaxID=41045 RepID=A0A8K1FJX6_PYTOL|nr:hypothetical protein Poli38472_002540 [Pythium oligandrum]|eukprot:TMW63599.1 hypothetical protein Poli38472_002540 [Pythium oligandrum]
MTQKLTDLIRSVRQCKTAAEERAVIAKESALIRTAIKDQDVKHRSRNVAKLLFIHMLGYPSHFGQMECVKLLASPHFAEKRMGYLGMILLLTDQEDVLTLVTNSMKNDLNNPNHFIAGLALTAVGNVANADMARDLVMDIDKHLRGDNDNLRKKAALAAVRVFQKVPELVEDFAESIHGLLRTKNHGVLLAGIHLIREVISLDPTNLRFFEDLVPTIVRDLRNLLSMGYSSEYDVGGIVDPFLQVAILKLLRILGKGNEEASEAMNDVLAQVATNTETAKNAGNAILYECVQTIMTIESDNGLKVLAINILGRFLLNRDNNIRYVALNTLSKVIVDDAAAVQRHTNTIVDCLKDPDTSIRQRAFELVYALVNSSNIQPLAREMLNYLVVAPNEQKPGLCSKIADVADRYSRSSRWHIDTLITMLSIAGATLPDERISNSLISLIQRSPSEHAYVVHKLFWALQDDITQLALVHVAIWCLGEYGSLLLQDVPTGEDFSFTDKAAVTETGIVDLFKKIVRYHAATEVTKSYALNAMLKLTTRLKGPAEVQKLRQMIGSFNNSMVLELQQRACEYTTLGEPRWDPLRPDILAMMPAIDLSKIRSRQERQEAAFFSDSDDLLGAMETISVAEAAAAPKEAPVKSSAASLLDLDDIFGSGPSAAAPPAAPVTATPAPANTVDLLADLFSTGPTPTPTPAPVATPAPAAPAQNSGDLLGLMDFGAPVAEPTPAPPQNPQVRAYEKNGLTVDLELTKPNKDDLSVSYINATVRNNSPVALTNFVFLAAFPKYIKLKMEPPSGDSLATGGASITQVVKIQNSMHGEKPILMRVRLEFLVNGNKVEDMVAVNAFPPDF